MSRHLRLIAFCAGLLASAGCSSERRLPTDPTAPGSTGPTEPSPPQPPSAPQRLAALALFESASLHEGLTTSPLTWATEDGKVVWTNGPCAAGSGSLQGSLDGGLAPTPGTFLPTGSHTYVVSFSNCLVHYLAGIELNGVASAAYSAAEWTRRSNQSTDLKADLTISRSPLPAPSTHLTGASQLHSRSALPPARPVTPARFESSITERWWRVFTATSATL
jgi:hypothetical protein